MDLFWSELLPDIPSVQQLVQISVRLLAAMLLGGSIGLQRQWVGKPAGLRTHMLVTLGTSIFVLACVQANMDADAVSRVIQGIVTGIGFIGAGSILKVHEERDIHGLTTAASIWVSAAIGVAIGLGSLGIAILSTLVTLGILSFAGPAGTSAVSNGGETTAEPSSDRRP